MSKKSVLERNNKRKEIVDKWSQKRQGLVAIMRDKSLSVKERFKAGLEVASMPLNTAKARIRNRCFITGRPRGYHRRFGISRIMMRELGLKGQIPGLTKSSW